MNLQPHRSGLNNLIRMVNQLNAEVRPLAPAPNSSNLPTRDTSSATIELLVAISQRADVKTPPADVTFKLQGRLLCSSSGLD